MEIVSSQILRYLNNLDKSKYLKVKVTQIFEKNFGRKIELFWYSLVPLSQISKKHRFGNHAVQVLCFLGKLSRFYPRL